MSETKLMSITEERKAKYERLAATRQTDVTVVLENVHDPHNVGAVLRSCDSVGISSIYVLYTHDNLKLKDFTIGKRASSGAWKYVEVHLFKDRKACFEHINARYDHIWATHLASDSVGLHDIDMNQSIALVFGNEHGGITPETLAYCTGNYIIPQMGITQSLNISVACAVSVYELQRQRSQQGRYDASFDEQNPTHSKLFEQYVDAHALSLRNAKREKHHHIKKHSTLHYIPNFEENR